MPKLKPGTIWPTPAKVDLTKGQLDEIAAGSMTFDEIEEKYGEEIAIEVGILRDPDNPEWTAEDFARARPAIEVVPHLVEHSIIRKIAVEYLDKGYDVSKEVSLDFFPGFRADLVVQNGDESKVIEVKSWSSLVADNRIAQLANIIYSKPDWTFELIFVGEPDKRDAPADTPENILHRIEQAEKILDSERPGAAFMLAWSACAAATKALAATEGVPRLDIAPATYILNRPRHLGAIAKGEYLNPNNLREYRNVISHFLNHDDLSADMVTALIATARNLTNELTAQQYAPSPP